DLAEIVPGLFFELAGQLLDEVRAAERVYGVGGAGLVGDDLLSPESDQRRAFGREGQRLVVAVAVQRLRAAEHGGQGLDRHARDVVDRLLHRSADAGARTADTR